MSDEGELVESGSFRVDRAKALEKLVGFRRRDVGCVMLFARCAAAAGAKNLEIDEGADSITLRFDGAPFTRRELVDPYAALFGEEGGESEPRTRWLALAFVHAWRPSLKSLSFASGSGAERALLEGSAFGEERVGKDESSEARTVVRLLLERADDAHWRHPVPAEMIATRPRSHLWGRMAVSVLKGGKAVSSVRAAEPGPGELTFEEDGVYGHLSIPPDGSEFSVVDAYIQGVYAGRVDWRDARAPVVGKVEDPALQLDASLAAIVQNERRERLEALVRRRTDGLVAKVARELGDRMPETARLLRSDAGLRRLWVSRLRGPEAEARAQQGLFARLASFLSTPGRREKEGRVFQDACAASWLREIAAESSGRRPSPADGSLWAAVDAAPLAFDADWRPVGYAELRAAARERRLSLVTELSRRGAPATLAVWNDGSPEKFWGFFQEVLRRRD
ncbi:MAG: hypothetical protein HY928_05495 [Elusimicrobia bacterium]|nr:hypothetical protein [Elusimicrobiota bacterium]